MSLSVKTVIVTLGLEAPAVHEPGSQRGGPHEREHRTMMGTPRERGRERPSTFECFPRNLPKAILTSATLSNINKQTVRSHHPDTMALPSGVYTIENVKYRNWAMLSDANQGEVVAGSSDSTDVGEKVSLLKM
jgi:hypothetical protein